jgi:hypothetical protein
VTALAVIGAYVEANPVHRYGGLHLTSHPPLAAYLLLAVPSLALIWRDSRPVKVLGLTVAGAVGWAALGQIDGAALVPVIVGVYWVALTRPRSIALAAGLAGAAAIFVAEGLLGPFGWFGGPLDSTEPPGPLPPPVALAVYRIVQESLTNVVRHAGRVAATVSLRQDGGYMHVDVVNDGGATPAAFSDGTGAGLAGMRERAAALAAPWRPGRAPAAGSPSAPGCQRQQPPQPEDHRPPP